MKYAPEYSKLLDGAYHSGKTNSDQNIARSISLFANNFSGFKKYRDVDDLSHVINTHRLLTIELLKYLNITLLNLIQL